MRTDHAGLEKLLKQYHINLQYLEEQAASYGGETYAPLLVRNQLQDTREKIVEIETQLHPVSEPGANRPDSWCWRL